MDRRSEGAEELIPSAEPSAGNGRPAPDRPVLQYSKAAGHELGTGGWVHVWKAADGFEANLIVGKLQEHGIHARVDMENAAALGAWGGVGAGGTTVQALAVDAAAAREIIAKVESDRAARRQGTQLVCPTCGHRPAKRLLHPARRMAVLILFATPLLGVLADVADVPSPFPGLLCLGGLALTLYLLFRRVTPMWRCPACQHSWSQAEPPEMEDD